MAGNTGGRELRALARRLKAAGNKQLEQRLRRGLIKATKRADPAIRAAFEAAMPSGYDATLLGSMKVRTKVTLVGGGAGVQVIASAEGKTEGRDLPALNAGLLRHPTYGHRDRWVAQAVPPGAFDAGIAVVSEDVKDEMDRVSRDIEAQIMKG